MGKWGLAIIGLAVMAAGLLFGSLGVTSGSLECGSVWTPDYSAGVDKELFSREAEIQAAEDECRDAVSGQRPLVYGVTGFGALLLVAGLVTAQVARQPDPA